MTEPNLDPAEPVAIVSMAARVPGADGVERFWDNLRGEVESISRFQGRDLLVDGHDPEHVLHPGFVGAEGLLDDPAMFDAAFFGYPPHEASIMDPQHRLCLELAWQVFDAVGIDPATTGVPTGVFLSTGLSTYLVRNLLAGDARARRERQRRDGLHLLMHNDKDFAATTVSYKLGLTGPSLAVGSACSSSLVAVHLAVRSLQSHECDLALAGGAAVQTPQGQGHVWSDDGVYSPDGRCAAFDESAAGTVGGNGGAVVLLKRRSDALRDGDHIHALVLGSAVNNDGGGKVGYTAPAMSGQTEVIVEAQAVAGIPPASIGYVEAHGTGTRLGDPIEVGALTEAFRAGTDRRGFCHLGSVKSNIGHLDAAAGIVGLVKAALVVRDAVIPASLHLHRPNPAIDWAASPFRVCDRTVAWPAGAGPRRAGVSSFGIGGTNAHVVLEQPASPQPRSRTLRVEQAVVLSAASPEALRRTAGDVAGHLRAGPAVDLADVAATLALRRALPYRCAVVGADPAGVAGQLERIDPPDDPVPGRPAVVIALDDETWPVTALRETEPRFELHLTECARLLSEAGTPVPAHRAAAGFAVGYALGRTLADWGVPVDAVLGGEPGALVTATLSGRLSLADAVRRVTADGPPAATAYVEEEIGRHLTAGAVAVVYAGIGPGEGDSIRRHPAFGARHRIVPALPAGSRPTLSPLLAELWTAGCTVDWAEVHRPQRPRRVALPGHRLHRRRHWIDPPPAPAPVPALREVGRWLQATLAAEPGDVRGVDDHPGLRAGLDRLCAELILWYFVRAGVDVRAGRAYGLADLVDRLGVRASYRPFVEVQLAALAQDGLVDDDAGTVTFRTPLDLAAVDRAGIDATAARLAHTYPGFAGLVELLVHCAEAYPRALSESGEGLRTLYPDGRADLLTRTLTAQTVEHRAVGRLTRLGGQLLQRLTDGADRPLRVLEVGAGTGALTRDLAAALGADRVVYHATDISRAFVSRLAAEARRRRLDWVRAGVLDITRDPAAQGMAGRRYDVVCGLDVVHVTPDIRSSLTHLRSLLAPGGLLLLVETVATDRWLPMIWGLSEAWWSAADGRRGGPLLGARDWAGLLGGMDFAATDVLTTPTGPRDAAFVLAQEPGVPAGHGSIVQSAAAADTTAHWPVKRPDPATWTYQPGWRHVPPPATQAPPGGQTCLLLSNGGPLTDEITRRLAAHGISVVLVAGAGPAAGSAEHRTIDPAEPRPYRILADELATAGRRVGLVVHLWALEEAEARGGGAGLDTFDRSQAHGLHSLLNTVRALAGRPALRLVTVTTGAQDVLGDDLTHPESATVLAAVKVVPREFPSVSCVAVDLPPAGERRPGPAADQVVSELLGTGGPAVVAYRGRRRFAPYHLPRPLAPAAPPAAARPRPGGVYLVCGGLGGIGLAVAGWLGRAGGRVVLTTRRRLPAESEWEGYRQAPVGDPVGDAVRRVLGLRDQGITVAVQHADITDLAAMRGAVAATERRFGPLTGVVHAAGVPDRAGMILRRDRAATDAAMAAKTRGLLVLETVLGDRPLEFLVLCSSIGNILPKLKFGEVGYVAGNEFLDAFAAYRSARRTGITVSITWTDWSEDGMWAAARDRLAHDTPASFRPAGLAHDGDLLGAISSAEGAEVLERILAHGVAPRVVVSSQDLDELLRRHEAHPDRHRTVLDRAEPAVAGGSGPAPTDTAGVDRTAAVPQRVAALFSALLGVPQVAGGDDFFDLGGDSLLALRLLAVLREEYGVDLPVADAFDQLTPAAVATLVQAAVGRAGVAP
ncbi:Phosphopantetheine attachment site [Micromonospora haikouensis]|uniref:Phosphopantetheine attachment site n=1 Tax=Micromonospora haikouensis TaxID=686309 RepID=A0A1C4XH66_9ACTN|nr:beta-ketoacyl synthase N-terminal-like domain-containing protein [Micromonospora haikouensis]SCF07706.1 Phosphopantetheine attachment site [Micromonospora haikouensis]